MTPDSAKWLLKYSAAVYEAERENSHKMRERANLILSLHITPYFGIAGYLAINARGELFPLPGFDMLLWIPLLFSVFTAVAAFAFVAYMLVRRFDYFAPPSPSKIMAYLEQHPDPTVELQEAQHGLLVEYAASVEYNLKTNRSKTANLIYAQRLALLAFVLLGLCMPEWWYNFSHNPPKIQSVSIGSTVPAQLLSGTTALEQPTDGGAVYTFPNTPAGRKAYDEAKLPPGTEVRIGDKMFTVTAKGLVPK